MSADPFAALLDMLAPVTPSRAIEPDRARRMTPEEQTLWAAGKLMELQGSAIMLRGEAMQYAARAAADPDFYAELAARSEGDATRAERDYQVERAKYSAKYRTRVDEE